MRTIRTWQLPWKTTLRDLQAPSHEPGLTTPNLVRCLTFGGTLIARTFYSRIPVFALRRYVIRGGKPTKNWDFKRNGELS
jgi:hypothetical protein